MRATLVAVLVGTLWMSAAASAVACDPYWDACDGDGPAWSDPVVWSAPGSDDLDAAAVATEPAPAALADPEGRRAELGLHVVTEVYAGHTVTTAGPVTTYATDTLALEAGTAARLLATVGTGEASAYDADLLGGRMTLSDGRVVAGAIYENYVWDGSDYVLNAYVFFQDDSETARAAEAVAPPALPASGPPAATTPETTPWAATSTSGAAPAAPDTDTFQAPASVAPLIEDVPGPIAGPPPDETPAPASRAVRAGVALAPQADMLDRVEVLRGRRVRLWIRADVDGVPARVVAWRLVSGELTALGPISGDGDVPLAATWRSVGPAGTTFAVRLRVSVAVPAEGVRDVDASIDVVVRAPALVE